LKRLEIGKENVLLPVSNASPLSGSRPSSPTRVTIHSPAGRESGARVCHLLTQDLSQGGIGIIYAKPLLEGQRIEVESDSGCRWAVVCRASRMADGRYLIGCRFEDGE
jgi:hypothetical protein